ncbi:MAG: phage tail sheath protein [Oscillospiraceae bacterium]|nr:phage tail sheath protein [Oscillospiraceae bacterium]
MTINTERSGVFTSYQATNVSYSKKGRGVAGLVAIAETGTANQVYTISSPSEARSVFGASNIAKIADILFANGVFEIKAIPVFRFGNDNDPAAQTYGSAFARIAAIDEVQVIVCDSRLSDVHAAMKTAILGADNRNRYKIGVVESDDSSSDTIITNAQSLNCERMIMVGPGALDVDGTISSCPLAAAAFAGAMLSESDPAVPMNGAELHGLGGVTYSLTEGLITNMVRAGVSPIECVGGVTSIIRGVTTYTEDSNGDSDPTWHEITTIRIVDDVIPEVRDSLRAMFARSKNTAQTRDAIKTQVVVILEKKVAAEIIDSYGNISVTQDEEDPTTCNVTFDFAVVHGINKIILTADITV